MSPKQHEIHKQHTFDCYCKKILKNEACNIQKEYAKLRNKEVSFDELSAKELESLSAMDEYFAEEYIFNVLDGKISVKDEQLAKALHTLPERKRDIVLLSYFLDMTDKEIAEKLNMVRKTVQYQRTSSLKQLRKRLEESSDEQS
ncbi:MAG: sigma-70 family RNA polymerase sigma factor [Hominilimicola sp.]